MKEITLSVDIKTNVNGASDNFHMPLALRRRGGQSRTTTGLDLSKIRPISSGEAHHSFLLYRARARPLRLLNVFFI